MSECSEVVLNRLIAAVDSGVEIRILNIDPILLTILWSSVNIGIVR